MKYMKTRYKQKNRKKRKKKNEKKKRPLSHYFIFDVFQMNLNNLNVG